MRFSRRHSPPSFRLLAGAALSLLVSGTFSSMGHAQKSADKAPDAWKRLYADEARASSFLSNNWNKFTENYHPNYLLDDNANTAWVEGVDGDGTGESVTIHTSAVAGAASIKLRIRNGYQKSTGLLNANAAPKEFEVTLLDQNHNSVGTQTIKLEKKADWQEFVVALPKKSSFGGVQLKVLSTHAGTQYKDMCVSDLQIYVDGASAQRAKYDETVELAKDTALRSWIKSRVEDAKYFASLPKTYPFSATQYTYDDGTYENEESGTYDCPADGNGECKTKKNKNFVKLEDQLKSGKGALLSKYLSSDDLKLINDARKVIDSKGDAVSKQFYRVVSNNNLKIPDGLDSGFPVNFNLLKPFLDTDSVAIFEADKDTPVDMRSVDQRAYMRKWDVSQVRIEWADDAKKKLKRVYVWEHQIVVERGTYESRTHHVLTFNDKNQISQVVSINVADGDGHGYTITDIERDGAGKITGVLWRGASSYGDEGASDADYITSNSFFKNRITADVKAAAN